MSEDGRLSSLKRRKTWNHLCGATVSASRTAAAAAAHHHSCYHCLIGYTLHHRKLQAAPPRHARKPTRRRPIAARVQQRQRTQRDRVLHHLPAHQLLCRRRQSARVTHARTHRRAICRHRAHRRARRQITRHRRLRHSARRPIPHRLHQHRPHLRNDRVRPAQRLVRPYVHPLRQHAVHIAARKESAGNPSSSSAPHTTPRRALTS